MTRDRSDALDDLAALNCHCKPIDRTFMQAGTRQTIGVDRDDVPFHVQVIYTHILILVSLGSAVTLCISFIPFPNLLDVSLDN